MSALLFITFVFGAANGAVLLWMVAMYFADKAEPAGPIHTPPAYTRIKAAPIDATAFEFAQIFGETAVVMMEAHQTQAHETARLAASFAFQAFPDLRPSGSSLSPVRLRRVVGFSRDQRRIHLVH